MRCSNFLCYPAGRTTPGSGSAVARRKVCGPRSGACGGRSRRDGAGDPAADHLPSRTRPAGSVGRLTGRLGSATASTGHRDAAHPDPARSGVVAASCRRHRRSGRPGQIRPAGRPGRGRFGCPPASGGTFPPGAERAGRFRRAGSGGSAGGLRPGVLPDQRCSAAVAAQQEAVELRSRGGDQVAHGTALRRLSRMLWYAGQDGPADDAAEQALEVLEDAGDAVALAWAHSNAAQLACWPAGTMRPVDGPGSRSNWPGPPGIKPCSPMP